MINILKYNDVEIKVKNKGAELFSVVVDGEEFIWNKKEIWSKSSPILFPFVGDLIDAKYKYMGRVYNFGTKHGFARDKNFELLEKTNKKLSFILKSNFETRKIYPFDFELILNYEILSKNSIKMEYIVKNIGNNNMYFSLGYHTAFILPNNYEDYYLELDKFSRIESLLLKNGFVSTTEKRLIKEYSNKIIIIDEIFNGDAIILNGDITKRTQIIDKNSNRKITVIHDENFDYITYWRPKNSNFICIEPWYGISDFLESDQNIETKKGIKIIKKNEIFNSSLIYKFEK
ncbi:aldose epimerase family protein [Oceanivirga salmonicida]|uniref:aldose epimerase family protein n=1 Tax=Oceanivirga salmonicida TaxID=1769291 RepID=UPI00083447D8|nr:hypothetical protein [Oceanivirga salmonicida]